MSDLPNRSKESNAGSPSSSGSEKPAGSSASNETIRERITREISQNPRWREADPSGQGFVLVGARRSEGKPADPQPSEVPLYIATVPTEPTFTFIDPDRRSFPAPVPMGPYPKGTEQLIADCIAGHPTLTREEAIQHIWEAGGLQNAKPK